MLNFQKIFLMNVTKSEFYSLHLERIGISQIQPLIELSNDSIIHSFVTLVTLDSLCCVLLMVLKIALRRREKEEKDLLKTLLLLLLC